MPDEVYRQTEQELQEAIRSGDRGRIMACIREIAIQRQWADKRAMGSTTAGNAPYEEALTSGDQYIDACYPNWGDSLKARFKDALRHLSILELDEVIVMLAGWYQEQPAAAKSRSRKPKGGQPAIQRAWASYDEASKRESQMKTDKEVYEWLKENGCEVYGDNQDDPTSQRLPSYDTWARYVRKMRAMTEQQKNTPRIGRTGRSIIRASDS